jgi:hemoglobin-like flavoprotein
MTPEQIALVQGSFAHVVPIAATAATLFYQRLFVLDPALRLLFPSDLSDQGRKLMTMLRVAVNGLDRLDTIVPAVHALGRRHVGYGVIDGHYATVGAALLWTLQQGLGDVFTPTHLAVGSAEIYVFCAHRRTTQ